VVYEKYGHFLMVYEIFSVKTSIIRSLLIFSSTPRLCSKCTIRYKLLTQASFVYIKGVVGTVFGGKSTYCLYLLNSVRLLISTDPAPLCLTYSLILNRFLKPPSQLLENLGCGQS
jgi:hypothetical protein